MNHVELKGHNEQASPPNERAWHRRLQAIVFLLIWPTINLMILTAILFDLGVLSFQIFFGVALKLWLVFGISFLIIRGIESYFKPAFVGSRYGCRFLLHFCVIFAVAPFIGPSSGTPPPEILKLDMPDVPIIPIVVLALEIIIYLAIQYILDQQKHAHSVDMALRLAEINALRDQSNPHFLFNTLNLITAEISDDPENAKEVVYDLADLLRSNVRLAQQQYVSVKDELNWVELYLNLQQKRFKDRLSFEINIDSQANSTKVPALLMQPVIENTIKHGVAPHAAKSLVSVTVECDQDELVITVKDTGPTFDETQIREGDGFRILRQTLALHFPENHYLDLSSTPQGSVFTLRIPAHSETS